MLYQSHSAECITANPGLLEQIQAFYARWRSGCAQCGATGYVNLSGMNLPCAMCLGAVDGSGPYCPRCHSQSIYPGLSYWPSGQPCKSCGWANARDGAPIINCTCPLVVSARENIIPLTAGEVKASKEERLESLKNAGS